MVSFHLTEEQEQLRQRAAQFAQQDMRPVAADYDTSADLPWPIIEQATRQGLVTYKYPESYGGGGVDSLVTACLVTEELAWGCVGIANCLMGCDPAVLPILLCGTDDQKVRYVPRLYQAPSMRFGAFAIAEPEAGSDIAALRTSAVRDGAAYVLNGYKRYITHGDVADLYIVFATIEATGITAFIVEADTPGLTIGKQADKMGMRASHVSDIVLENVRVPAENRLGEEGQGFYIAMKYFAHNRPVVSALAVGLARAAYEYALDYARQRVQFGKPIIANQSISFMLADMAIEIEAARLLVWQAAWQLDQGQSGNLSASMAKAFASDLAMRVTTNAVQILGGHGVMRDYPVEKWMRDAKILQIVEGTSQIQRMIIAQLSAVGSR
ncbi:MAG: acyl-CoA dehydrogenase [Chloroflexi bacterium]|nr:acyl-CoA dehydrogenase [Chloroflexota bacterium]